MAIRILLLIFMASTVACSKFTTDGSPQIDQSYFSSGEGGLIPQTDKLVEGCKTSAQFDACIFLKNPVSQQRATLESSQLDAARKFGIKLRGLSRTGFLENAYIQVLTLHSPKLSLLNLAPAKEPIAEGKSAPEQVMAYYWANRAVEYLSARIGAENVPIKGLKIYVDDTFTGYSSSNRSIHLEKRGTQIPKAFSADVILQLLGQAMAFEASGKSVLSLSNIAKHNFCLLSPKGCCSADVGCANALAGSAGDYLNGIMFPTSPVIGESVAGQTSGMKVCEIDRNLATLNSKTKAQVYSACAKAPGNAVLMGAWYASLWWKVRDQAEALEAGGAAQIDKLFFQHMKTWTAASTFTEAKTSALELATAHDGGKFLSLFQTAFAGI